MKYDKDKRQFIFTHNDDKYIFTCTKNTKEGKNSLSFDLRLDLDIVTSYYELDYDIKSLKNLSEILFPFSDLEEIYNFLTDNFKRYEKDIKLEIFLEKAKLLFKLDSADKKEEFSLILNQKENNKKNLLFLLHSRIKKIGEEHNELEKSIRKNSEFIIKKDNVEEELINKIKEVEDIKKECMNVKKKYSDNNDKINEIKKIKKDNFEILKELNNNNKECEVKKKNFERRIKSIKKGADLIKKNLDENEKILGEISDNLKKCQNNSNILDNEINEVKENENNINQTILENKEINYILKEIEKLQKENYEIQNKLEENNKKLNFLNKTLEEIESYEKKGKKYKIKSNKKMNKVSEKSDLKTPNEENNIK